MPQFLTEELDNEMYYLIDRVNNLRDILEDARRVKNFEDFDDLMESAWESAQSLRSDIDDIRYEVSELHSKEK